MARRPIPVPDIAFAVLSPRESRRKRARERERERERREELLADGVMRSRAA
jgi:hypothetical protein